MAEMIKRRRKMSGYAIRHHSGNMLFLLPTIILFGIVVLMPFIQGIPYSFTSWKSILSPNHPYNGLTNYNYLLGNKYFRQSLGVTFHFTLEYLLLSNIFGFALALLIHKSSQFNNVARTIFFLPFTISVAAGAIVWKYLYIDVFGTLFNTVSPLSLESQIVPGMAVMASWRDMGYCMLIYIAALQTISRDYYEAATVEGANSWQQFWRITIPMIVPAFTTNITLILSWGLRTFDLSMNVSANMAAGQTTAYYIYQSIFQNSKVKRLDCRCNITVQNTFNVGFS